VRVGHAVTILTHSKDLSVARSLDHDLDESTSAPEFFSVVWRKSTRSIGNGQCVEAAQLPDGRLAMRDSMDKSGPAILFAQEEWHLFLRRVKEG
jgi:Domain of unknown function (DUF397)